MKKVSLILIAGLIVSSALFAFGQKRDTMTRTQTPQTSQGAMQKPMMQAGGQMGAKDSMHMGMSPMHGAMHGMMIGEPIATSDGGLIIRLGNKLVKYDKDLNLVKEVELKIDFDAMARMMNERKMKCPMCKTMHDERGMKKEMEKR